MSDLLFEPFKDKFNQSFENFENEMREMGITDYNEGLKKVVEKWEKEYERYDLISQVWAILMVADWREISFDDEVVESLRRRLLKQGIAQLPVEDEPLFTRDDYVSFLRMNHHGRPDILLCKVMMIIGFSSMARCEEMRGLTIYHINVFTVGTYHI